MSFDRVAEVYDKTRSLPSEVMSKLIRSFSLELKGYRNVLDLGVGTGRFAKPLQDEGFEVVGIDISRKMISKADEKGVHNLLLGDARFLPFNRNTFDVVVCVHIFHLIGEWSKALIETCRVTRYSMFSLFYAKQDPVREAYDNLLKKHGYTRNRPGKSEQELANLVSPVKSVHVASYRAATDERLINLAQGTFSSQWEIPKVVNHEIVEELRSQFMGKTLPQELRLLIWKIEDLRAYIEKVSV